MKRVLILLGPTGVGKTGASILLARKLGTEIIGSDSMQIYRGMDIGTAKPTLKERAAVRHHMIDVVDPSESFSTGQYIEKIVPVIEDLHAKGKIPLIVGGTGLYIKAITRGIFDGPSADWALRENLLEIEEGERGSLYAYLSEIDPDAAGKIERNDTRRIVRAIEVRMKSGEKISRLQKMCTRPLPYEFIKIGLERERKELYRMIEERVDKMVTSGLEEEVAGLLRGTPDKTPLQAIGYKEFAMHIKGEITLEEAVALIKRNTRRYAKRQFTWFRKEEEIQWIDITGVHTDEEITGTVEGVLRERWPGLLPRTGRETA
jgi:tRNA dimethylallyltransferase